LGPTGVGKSFIALALVHLRTLEYPKVYRQKEQDGWWTVGGEPSGDD
jgi:hypothetical protein